MVWYSVACYGVLWCDFDIVMEWFGTLRLALGYYCAVCYNIAWYGMDLFYTVWHGMVRYGMVLCGVVWFCCGTV